MSESEADRLFADGIHHRSTPREFVASLHRAEESTLAELVYRFGGHHQAMRDSVRAVLDRRLADRQIAAMERLDRSARFLAVVGIGVGILQVVFQLWG